MTDREMDQARLLDSYWTALARDPNAAVPDGLDAATAETTRRLCLEISSTEPEPAFTSTLRRTLQVRAAEMASRPRAVSAPIGRRFNLGGFVRRLSAVAAAVLVLIVAGFFAVGVAASGLEQPSAVSFSPTALKDVPANAPVSITFDRPMLGPLAERALRIEPAVEGSFSWKGNTMQFTPRTGWSRETVYTVSLDQGARGMLLLPLKSPVHYEFMTAKDLTVLSVQPGDGATNVDPSNGIVAQFNYPIVPLGAAGQGPNALVIEPAVPGRGKWVTTSLYMYQPDGGLASGVTYRVTVPKGLQDTGGGKLAADYGWSFTTKAPSVGMVSPEANTRFAGPRQEVRVTFDQPVDHASAESRFSLKSPAGDAVPGSISWDGEVMVFKPSAPLKLDTQYTATVASGVAATKGGGLSEAFSWRFTTVGAPRVTSTTPAQGAQLPPYDAVQIQFSNPMDHDAVEKAISISPQPPQKWRTSWQESDTKAFVLGGLKP
ncbi:MAG TPA: Ig-like domain-containing protein, partial [Chloroflexota bacterium]